MKTYTGCITELKPHQIFVFGSNKQSVHGAGAALVASKKFGAKYGQAEGLMGQSYGIVTTDLDVDTRPSVTKTYIVKQVEKLYQFAIENPEKEFYIIYSGQKGNKNLSGFENKELALMFHNGGIIPKNIVFEEQFYNIITSF